jgi:Calpain family cysteine protease
VHDGLVSFTGGAAEEINLRGEGGAGGVEALWARLRTYERSGFLMGAGSPPGADTAAGAVNGIVQGHAYALLRMNEVRLNEATLKMIKLRNPWKANPVTDHPLDWSPTSPLWTQTGGEYMKRKLGYDPCAPDTDAGVLWLRFEDFVQAFATIFVCRCVTRLALCLVGTAVAHGVCLFSVALFGF